MLLALLAGCLLPQPVTAQGYDAPAPPTSISPKLAKILAKTDGRTQATAIKVSSVQQEYKILKELQLKVVSQALVMDPKADQGSAYDLMTTTDRDGKTIEMWFLVPFGFGL